MPSNDPQAQPENELLFTDLNLSNLVLKALNDVGYEKPSPIQAATIPVVMQGKDVLGQAQTGTGKTAAFALPLLSVIDTSSKSTQALILAPTRELAIQVAEAFQKYASHMKGFNVIPIYGGQDYGIQLKQLRRGAHIVVGTPGRVMDHMRRGTLKLDQLQTLVLDEADEMLRMGFVDDVKWVLEQLPEQRQIALFSATMPNEIRKIADKYLQNPEHITIKSKTTTAQSINQRYWPVSGLHKLDALTRILEVEDFDGAIIFVRTKTATVELADKLQARGFSASALNGDIAQNQRERIVDQLKKARIDILVATDVVARGLDVERISHVINYDIPHDTESYVHRIGRTGRAGRTGDAILFVAPREKRLLRSIENATKQTIARMELPSVKLINDQRIAKFQQEITDTLNADDLAFYQDIIEQYKSENEVPEVVIAAALAKLVHRDQPLLLKDVPQSKKGDRKPSGRDRDRNNSYDDSSMQTYRIEVGHEHKVKPGNIMGAIANEAGLDSKDIGRIKIYDDYSTVDLPEGMPKEVFMHLKKVRVANQTINISALSGGAQGGSDKKRSKSGGGKSDKRRSKPGPGSKPSKRKPSSKPRKKDKKSGNKPN